MSSIYRINLQGSITVRADPTAPSVPNHVVNLVRDLTRLWTPEYFCGLVASGVVPTDYLEMAMGLLMETPKLAALQPEEFLRACEIARPDLYPHLATVRGQEWLGRASDELGRRMGRRLLSMFFGGGG